MLMSRADFFCLGGLILSTSDNTVQLFMALAFLVASLYFTFKGE